MCDFEGAARVRLTQLAQEAFGEDEAKTLKSIFMQQQISQTKTQRAEGIMLKRAESLSPRTAGVSAMQSSLSRSAESLQLKAKSTSGSDLTASAPLDSGNTKNSVLVAQNLIQLEATKLATVALRDFVGCKWLTSTDFIDITAYLDLCERVCRALSLSLVLEAKFVLCTCLRRLPRGLYQRSSWLRTLVHKSPQPKSSSRLQRYLLPTDSRSSYLSYLSSQRFHSASLSFSQKCYAMNGFGAAKHVLFAFSHPGVLNLAHVEAFLSGVRDEIDKMLTAITSDTVPKVAPFLPSLDHCLQQLTDVEMGNPSFINVNGSKSTPSPSLA